MLKIRKHVIWYAKRLYTSRAYSSNFSVLLPKTDFPLRISPKNRKERDAWISEKAMFNQLYQWQRAKLSHQDKEFILHDGPPYANGQTHMGHAVNKILKDITIRYQLLSGNMIHYVPGWDCHGLPIEIKALESTSHLKDPVEIRKRARSFALQTIEKQKESFLRWGVMADWTGDCYYTLSPQYVTNQLQIFYQLYEKGLVFRDYKPVYWSPSSRTALAESELEYNPNHVSTSIYLKLLLHSTLPEYILLNIPNSTPIFIVIWTTTPWTLAANQAVCFNPEKDYCLVRTKGNNEVDEYWIVACDLKAALEQLWSKKLIVVNHVPGDSLSGCSYYHPLQKTKILPLLPASHVTIQKGTGFVHTAPAHGPEDFLVALQHKIPVLSLVDEKGCYINGAGEELVGLNIFDRGQEKILSLLNHDIIYHEKFIHNYPYDWRTKLPVILRASLQWFIDTDNIKQKALEAIKTVIINPPNLEKPMLNQLENRPYWCISRQRSWGVPIPVFYKNDSAEKDVILSKEIIEKLCKSTKENGSIDHWWLSSPEELIGDELMKKLGLKPGEISKGRDILDIWFDSGISWSSVLPLNKQADLYLEGIDQFGGWFQSSLLTSVACTGRSPYKKLFVHGFALDSSGRKMSKSIGNVIDPQEVIDGDEKNQKAYGIDVLRWWVASHVTGNGSGIPVSNQLIELAAEDVQKIRSILRFLLGNLNDITLHQIKHVKLDNINLVDQYTLHLLSDFVKQALTSYEEMNYKKVASLVIFFLNNAVSGFYCSILKDRLYCQSKNSELRMSAIYVLSEILDQVTVILAPILPHLTEEIEIHHPWHSNKGGLFRNRNLSDFVNFNKPEIVSWMNPALAVRQAVNQMVGRFNIKEWIVHIEANINDHNLLQKFQHQEISQNSALCELLQTSSVTLTRLRDQSKPISTTKDDALTTDIQHSGGLIRLTIKKSSLKPCPRCRRYVSNDGLPCYSCSQVLLTSKK